MPSSTASWIWRLSPKRQRSRHSETANSFIPEVDSAVLFFEPFYIFLFHCIPSGFSCHH